MARRRRRRRRRKGPKDSRSFIEQADDEDDDEEVVVFVHGFTGFSADELLGYQQHSWPLPPIYRKEGFKTVLPDISPFNSNWDRACELYASLVGGTVDYGIAHSKKVKHDRFGKRVEATYAKWDADHPVHLIGHSMGGLTIRMLEYLLNKGDADEIAAAKAAGKKPHPLFTGGKGNWIKSITTVASPLDGSTYIDDLDLDSNKAAMAFIRAATILTGLVDGNPFYSAETGHMGWEAMADVDFKDLGIYDLSSKGAHEIQKLMPMTYPETRYFAFAAFSTQPKKDGSEVATPHTPISSVADVNRLGSLKFPKNLRPNDNCVPLVSARCPFTSYSAQDVKRKCKEYDESSESWPPGIWWYKDVEMVHAQTFFAESMVPSFLADPWVEKAFEKFHRMHARRILAAFGKKSWEKVKPAVTIRPEDSDEETGNPFWWWKSTSADVDGLQGSIVSALLQQGGRQP